MPVLLQQCFLHLFNYLKQPNAVMPRLTLDQIPSLRAQSGPISTQVAGHVTSDQFRSSFNSTKPRGVCLEHHSSEESRNFAGSALKKAASKAVPTPFVSLGTGRPQAELYPWDSLALEVCSPTKQGKILNGNTAHHGFKTESDIITRRSDGMNLARGLNYGHAAGLQPLVRFITEHVELVHDPPYRNWSTSWTCGSTSAMEILLRMFCNRGDTILAEQYTYPGTLEVADLMALKTLGIEMDADGLIPERLQEALRNWDEAKQGRRPALLYTIPSGQNPTGITQSTQRKKAIYEVAEAYDLIVVEDDPYYFLRLGDSLAEVSHSEHLDETQTVTSFLSSLPPSYLNLDTSGRVVRLDSTSKILAPGLRAGWITASDIIIEKFLAYSEVSTVAVSGPTQLLLWHLLEASWGHAGFFNWLEQLSQQYRGRTKTLLRACEKYLPMELCNWIPPQNGMFAWIALDLTRHPGYSDGVLPTEIEARLYENTMREGVQITKGSMFDTRGNKQHELNIRLTTAAADEEEFDEAVRKLGKVLRAEFGIVVNGVKRLER